MLRKLLKYELKATARLLFPMYLAVILFSGINRLLWLFPDIPLQNEILERIFSGMQTAFIIGLVFLVIASFIVTFIVSLRRFYVNLLCDEGYLMHTLPVKIQHHIFSKLLVATLWQLVCFVVVMVTLFILLATPEGLKEMYLFITEDLVTIYRMSTLTILDLILFFAEFAFVMILSCVSSMLLMYASMSIGNLFNRRRILYSVAGYLILTFIVETIETVGTFLFFYGFSVMDMPMVTWIEENIVSVLHIGMGVTLLFSLVLCAVYYGISHYILKNKLNLQ